MFRIFEKLGGVEATLDVLQKRLPPSRKRLSAFTIKGWKIRRRIPNTAVALLALECEERGISYEMSDFKSDAPKQHSSASHNMAAE